MLTLKNAITIIEIIFGVGVALILGDYLGYKIGRWKLAAAVGIAALVLIVAFAILAAVVLR